MPNEIEVFKENDEIELMDLFLVLWRRKSIIIGIVLFSVVCALLLITFQKKELRTEMVIGLNFEGINKGIYPDGSIFESIDIISPNVLSKLNLNIDLSGHVFVEALIPNQMQLKLKEDSAYIYYPNRFKIVLLEYEPALFDSNKERADTLKAIAKAFKINFEKKFIEESAISIQFPDDFINTSEYDDVTYVIENNINLTESIIARKSEITGAFKSKENRYIFSDLLSQLIVLRRVDFKNVVSEIKTRHLAKNKERLLARISEDIKDLEYERLKSEKMAKVSYDLLASVKDSAKVSRTGQVPGQAETKIEIDSTFYEKLKENEYIFYLIKLSLDAENKAIENSVKISQLKDRLDGIKNNGINFERNDKEITGRLISIQNKLLEIVKSTNTLNREYLELKFGQAIYIGNTPEYIQKNQYDPKLILPLTFVGALFFSVFLSFLVDYVIRYKKND